MKNAPAPIVVYTYDEHEMLIAICERAEQTMDYPKEKRARLVMDLCSIPELDLEALANASNGDFGHDINGIINNMDRSTYPGKLMNCFWPRCAEQI